MNHEEEVQLREAAGKTAALEAENKRLKEAAISREAKDLATVVLADIEMPDAMRARITESAKPVLSETGALDVEAFKTAVTEAAAQELEYFQSMGYGDGKVRGHGANAQEKHRENSLDGVQNVREAAGL